MSLLYLSVQTPKFKVYLQKIIHILEDHMHERYLRNGFEQHKSIDVRHPFQPESSFSRLAEEQFV